MSGRCLGSHMKLFAQAVGVCPCHSHKWSCAHLHVHTYHSHRTIPPTQCWATKPERLGNVDVDPYINYWILLRKYIFNLHNSNVSHIMGDFKQARAQSDL